MENDERMLLFLVSSTLKSTTVLKEKTEKVSFDSRPIINMDFFFLVNLCRQLWKNSGR